MDPDDRRPSAEVSPGACDLAPIWRTGATLMVVVKDLKKRFGETEALKGVSFEVEPGTVLGVLGPN
ncbi:MAG: hypothetical protein R2735_12170 [Microthrixaceae bacterium]